MEAIVDRKPMNQVYFEGNTEDDLQHHFDSALGEGRFGHQMMH